MKKKVLIVCPAPEACRTGKRKRSIVSRFFRHTRLSLLTVAAATPPEWDVDIVDEYISPIDFQKDYDCAAVSFMTAGAPRAYEIAEIFKRKHIPVIAGGYHPTFRPNEVLKHFDSVCVGDAEQSWPVILSDIGKGILKKIYESNPECSLSNIPIPRRDLLSTSDYHTRNTVQTSRGCPNTCKFCSITAFHKGIYRHRPIAEIIKEIEKLSGKLIIFIDDNIISDRTFALQFFAELAKLERNWFSQAELKIARDSQLLDAAVKSGCRGIFAGLESLSNVNLKKMNKGFSQADDYMSSIEILHNSGIAVEAGFAFGFDDDTTDVFEETLNFLIESSVEVAQITILTPFPGTPLYNNFDAKRRILTKEWQYYDFNHVVFRPKNMSPKELQQGTDMVIDKFYSMKNITKRVKASFSYLGTRTTLGLVLPLSLAIRKRVTTWEKRPTICGQGLYWLPE